MESCRTRAVLLFLLVPTFGVLLFGGYLIHREKPPIPQAAATAEGRILFIDQNVADGQNYFYSRGGQHIGTIWGHGAYLAPDWSADCLHQTGLFLAARHLGRTPEDAARFTQTDLDRLDAPEKARVTALVVEQIKANRYDCSSGRLTLTPSRLKPTRASCATIRSSSAAATSAWGSSRA